MFHCSNTLVAAAAAAKLLQLCPTLSDPVDSSPPGSSVPGILQARTLGWVAISFSNAWQWKVKVKSLEWVAIPFSNASKWKVKVKSLEWGAIAFSNASKWKVKVKLLEWGAIAFSNALKWKVKVKSLEWGAIPFSNAWKWKVKVKSLEWGAIAFSEHFGYLATNTTCIVLLFFLDTETQISPESEREKACRVLSKWKLPFLLWLLHNTQAGPQRWRARASASAPSASLAGAAFRWSRSQVPLWPPLPPLRSKPTSSPPESWMTPTASNRLLSICRWLPRNHSQKRPTGSCTSESARVSLLLARAVSGVSLTQSNVLK